jgi:hypothetical protein
MAQRVNVTGVRELVRAADAAGKETKKIVRDRLRKMAEPVLQESRARLSLYDARSASRLGVSVRRSGTVSVEQRLRRTTGAHPQFGSLQMTEALIPALDSNSEEIMRGFEDAVDDIVKVFER